MISDGTTAVQAFEAGEVDVTGTLPPDELPRLKDTPEYDKYDALGTYYYGLNVKNIPDVNQRRAMALAIDRKTIIDNIAQADQAPADRLHAEGHAGLRHDRPELAVAPRVGRHGEGEGPDVEGHQSQEVDHALVQRGSRRTRRSRSLSSRCGSSWAST